MPLHLNAKAKQTLIIGSGKDEIKITVTGHYEDGGKFWYKLMVDCDRSIPVDRESVRGSVMETVEGVMSDGPNNKPTED